MNKISEHVTNDWKASIIISISSRPSVHTQASTISAPGLRIKITYTEDAFNNDLSGKKHRLDQGMRYSRGLWEYRWVKGVSRGESRVAVGGSG